MSELLDFILAHEEPFKSKARLASLYADFSSQKSLNPDGYHANISAWRNAISHASRAGLVQGPAGCESYFAIQTGDTLEKALRNEIYGRPLALGAVIDESVIRREMIPLKEFLEMKTSIYQRPWMQLPTPWEGARWILRQFGLAETGHAAPNGSFVMVASVEEAARKILSHISKRDRSPSSLIFSPSTFLHTFSTILSPNHALSMNDMTILLTHLSRDHSALSFTSNTIKFRSSSATSTELTAQPQPITQNDNTIAELQSLSLSLTTQISSLESRITLLEANARAAVANRTAALSALRSKKLAQSSLHSRLDSLSLIESTLAKIDDAAGQVEMVKAMESSASVLKALNKDVGGIERVDRIMDDLREETVKVDEVQSVLNEATIGADGRMLIDDEELDEELEVLQKQERERVREEQIRSKLQDLPHPVTSEPKKNTENIAGDEPEMEDDSLAKSIAALSDLSIVDKPTKAIVTT